jgi:hypothetical protein
METEESLSGEEAEGNFLHGFSFRVDIFPFEMKKSVLA